MDHMDVYPKIVSLIDNKVLNEHTFTAHSAHEDLESTLQEPVSYDELARPAIHTAMVKHLGNGYDKRLKDFGGRWNAWEYFPPGTFPKMLPVDSSSLAKVGYDRSLGRLWIEFQNGRTYTYNNVGAGVFADLMCADSHGKFFNEHIRDGVYKYQEV